MGSSFAAGPGIGRRAPGSPRAAGRSSANYAHLVARRLALELDDVTFSGATTQDILAATAAGRPAQIDAVTPATKLVTLTGGGNDVGWAPRILLSSLPRPARAIPPVRRQLDSYADPDLTEQRFGTLREDLLKIAAEVRRRAPESRLVFVDYLTVLPPDATTPTGVLPADVAEWGRAVARRLSGITRDVAGQIGSVFVAASAASANHHAWSADPWTRRFHLSLRGGAPYHPNAAGMAAVAELVAAALPAPRGLSRLLPGPSLSYGLQAIPAHASRSTGQFCSLAVPGPGRHCGTSTRPGGASSRPPKRSLIWARVRNCTGPSARRMALCNPAVAGSSPSIWCTFSAVGSPEPMSRNCRTPAPAARERTTRPRTSR